MYLFSFENIQIHLFKIHFKNSYHIGIKKGVTISNTFKILTIVNHYFL